MQSAGTNDDTAPAGPRAIVAGHGSFAVGVISAVELITGRGSVFTPISNVGLSAADIEVAVSDALDRTGALVIFTDLPAGSCTMAARRLQRARPDVIVVTGVNLATLLDFVFRDASQPPAAMARDSVEKGRGTMAVFGG